MNIYLLRVGADSTPAGGGFRSPIFPDSSFVFMPIPEKECNLILSKARTYRDFKWNNISVVQYLPRKIWKVAPRDQFIHNDPEFETFTYGSPRYNSNGNTEKNYKSILKMQGGDILAFYAAFLGERNNRNDMDGLYFFAYLIVDHVIEWDSPGDLRREEQALVRNNHHFIHKRPNQVVIVGKRDKSKIFKKAILLSSSKTDRRGANYTNYYPCQSIKQILDGYYASMNFSSIRKPPIKEAAAFKDYLDRNC
jgi:hypothetical protein